MRLEEPRRHTPTVPRWHNEWLSVNLLAKTIHAISSRVTGTRLLDIACGNEPYRPWFPNARFYVGIDIVRANNVADVIAASDHLPFAPETFEGALCTQALEHVEEPIKLLREAWRVLKPGGKLLLSAPMYWHHHEDPYDFYRYTRYGLRYLLERANFQIEEIVQQGGAWRVVGQSLVHTFVISIPFRTFGLRAFISVLLNTLFDWLDRINFHPQDTCNFVVLARKITRNE